MFGGSQGESVCLFDVLMTNIMTMPLVHPHGLDPRDGSPPERVTDFYDGFNYLGIFQAIALYPDSVDTNMYFLEAFRTS